MNMGTYVRLVLDSRRHQMPSQFASVSTPTSVNMLNFLRQLSLVRTSSEKTTVNLTQSCAKDNLIVLCVQFVTKAQVFLLDQHCGNEFTMPMAPFMWFDRPSPRFFVLGKRSEQSLSSRQIGTLRGVSVSFMRAIGANTVPNGSQPN